MRILVINSGSSSIKYQLFDMERGEALCGGIVERIGLEMGRVRHWALGDGGRREWVEERPVPDHRLGLAIVAGLLIDAEKGAVRSPDEIDAVGHRVVHGGERFSQTTRITDEVIDAIRELIPLAPLHNPANLKGVEVAREIFPRAEQVAVFDTAFHQTMPPRAYRYAIPTRFYEERGVRVYGFHGTSHLYVSKVAARHLGKPLASCNLITAHLGNGASIAAVERGRSVDTSMGFSPLPGLMMGTRSGDIDPAVVFHLHQALGLSLAEIDRMLNKESGLLGVCGSSDMRDVEARFHAGDADARLALEMYAYRIKKYIGAYVAALGRVDALVFTAGVGENSALVREMACRGLESLGIVLDLTRNNGPMSGEATAIHAGESAVEILVIPTNEELEIALQTRALVEPSPA
ncbi:MAG: acetate kinase [Chloroflexi bacterium]|nr:acetate kinase [Chloroflexota bacterium]